MSNQELIEMYYRVCKVLDTVHKQEIQLGLKEWQREVFPKTREIRFFQAWISNDNGGTFHAFALCGEIYTGQHKNPDQPPTRQDSETTKQFLELVLQSLEKRSAELRHLLNPYARASR